MHLVETADHEPPIRYGICLIGFEAIPSITYETREEAEQVLADYESPELFTIVETR